MQMAHPFGSNLRIFSKNYKNDQASGNWNLFLKKASIYLCIYCRWEEGRERESERERTSFYQLPKPTASQGHIGRKLECKWDQD